MSSPYESFGDVRISFIVDSQSSVIDKPCPGPLDDPSAGKGFKGVGRDAIDDFGSDSVAAAMIGKSLLEPAVTPQLREPARFGSSVVNNSCATQVVRDVGSHNQHGDKQPEGVDKPKGLAARDLLANVKAPGRAPNGGSTGHAASIDDARRGL